MEAVPKVNILFKSYILRGLLVKGLHCEKEGHGSNPNVGTFSGRSEQDV